MERDVDDPCGSIKIQNIGIGVAGRRWGIVGVHCHQVGHRPQRGHAVQPPISKKGPEALPDTWLLIDRCSTIDIISSLGLLHGIHKVNNPIWIWCSAGVTILDQMGFLGDYPQPVWINPHGGSNIMLMFNIASYII